MNDVAMIALIIGSIVLLIAFNAMVADLRWKARFGDDDEERNEDEDRR